MELPATDDVLAWCSLSSALCPTVVKLVVFIVYRIGVVGNRETPGFLCMLARWRHISVQSGEGKRS